MNVEASMKEKKRKTKHKSDDDNGVVNDESIGVTVEDSSVESKKGKKKRKKREEEHQSGTKHEKKRKLEHKKDDIVQQNDMAVDNNKNEEKKKKKKKKKKNVKDAEEKNVKEGETRTKSAKKVKFSSEVEIFPISNVTNYYDDEDSREEGRLVRGKRFSKEEDKIIQEAVLKYIKEHDLGDDGVTKVMRCRNYPEIRTCWKEISAVMPWRTQNGIYNRAHILFERADKREWTLEERENIRKFHEKYGPDWRKFADEHGKSRIHVKDTWRRINIPNKKDGPWSQEEYQDYFKLVNIDLRMKINEEKKSKHGMLRDDIAWGAISVALKSRSNSECCRKWYSQLASPLVQKKMWSDLDDYRLLNELSARDFSSVEEVDWDNLLGHRAGDICRKRWYQMVNHLGEHGNKPFADQLEVLLSRYCPEVEVAREIYQNKTPVD